MIAISGFGLQVNILATGTFPQGFTVTQFADDADPLDLPQLQIADSAMGLNGDLITWSKASPIKMTLNVVPYSDDDINLSILLEANRVGKGKSSSKDEITAVLVYPSGDVVTLINGIITDGAPVSSVSSAGRLKSKSYVFAFENKIGA